MLIGGLKIFSQRHKKYSDGIKSISWVFLRQFQFLPIRRRYGSLIRGQTGIPGRVITDMLTICAYLEHVDVSHVPVAIGRETVRSS